jgi:polysaccharide deacetylase family protein (PEP-CTERM system associated)
MNDFVNVFTVDFEDWYQGIEIDSAEWNSFQDRIEIGADRILYLLAKYKTKATFFVLSCVAEHYPHLVRTIQKQGHEIGTHGYSHAFIYQQSREQFATEFRKSLQVLEDITRTKVKCHRAPFFSITEKSLWALDILMAEGITCDSSIFPVHNYRYGIPDAPRVPYHIQLNGRSLLEVPISTCEFCGKNIPMAGGAYFRIFPYWLTKRLIQRVNRQGYPVIFYIHPWELDPDHPRIPLPRRIAATHYYNLKSTEQKLEKLLKDFHFTTMKNVIKQMDEKKIPYLELYDLNSGIVSEHS